ncbi:MAG: Hint domain-containing protein [Ruegeria sp.]
MLKVVSVSEFPDQVDGAQPGVGANAQAARRRGFIHGTRIATTAGWTPVERIAVGDLVRTLDNGFREVRRLSSDLITIRDDESRAEVLPVQVPAHMSLNGRAIWLMPEQEIALEQSRLDPTNRGRAIIAARLLAGAGRLRSRAPSGPLGVTSLFFDEDEVVLIDGGLQAFCASGRSGSRPASGRKRYRAVTDEETAHWVKKLAGMKDLTSLAKPLGALPALVPDHPIFPIRPPKGQRRPGRPGRPAMPTLFLRPEWMMIRHQP